MMIRLFICISKQSTESDVTPCLFQTFVSIVKIESINNAPYSTAHIYGPANRNAETLRHDVDAQAYFSPLSNQYYTATHWIIGGDFNVDLFSTSNYADSFINILMCGLDYSLMSPTIYQSTHPSSRILIDNELISRSVMISFLLKLCEIINLTSRPLVHLF